MEANIISEEHQRLTAAIDANTYRDQHVALYAARQALSWAINPERACSPYAMIMNPDTHQVPEDYLAEPHPALS